MRDKLFNVSRDKYQPKKYYIHDTSDFRGTVNIIGLWADKPIKLELLQASYNLYWDCYVDLPMSDFIAKVISRHCHCTVWLTAGYFWKNGKLLYERS